MAANGNAALRVPLELPERGQARCAQQGRWQLIVERDRQGALTVLAHDGRQAQRWLLGGRRGGTLELRLQAPRFPVRVRLTGLVTLAPGGRLRGYVSIPLPVDVVWRTGDGGAGDEVLAQLLPRHLRTAWLGRRLGYVHETSSTFALELEHESGECDAMVPVFLSNQQPYALSPDVLLLRVHPHDLVVARGRIVAAPRSLLFCDGPRAPRVIEQVHGFLGRRS